MTTPSPTSFRSVASDASQRDASQRNAAARVQDGGGVWQISLGWLMLVMVIFGMISAGFLYASRVPAVQQEWAAIWGTDSPSTDDAWSGRTQHLLFILFTLTSPLLMAITMSTALALLRYWNRPKRRTHRDILES